MSATIVRMELRPRAWRARRGVGATITLSTLLAACAGDARDHELRARGDALSSGGLVGTSLPAKTLALTFDDGPGDRTVELSMYLKAQGIAATFFVNGGHLATTTLPNPNGIAPVAGPQAVLAQLVADGHLVANHTVTHRDMVTQVLPAGAAQLTQEVSETDALIAGYVPSNHFLFRPPYGSYDAAVFGALAATPMNKYVGPVMWDAGGSSTSYPNAAADWACWQGQLREAGGGLANGTGYATTAQCGDAYLNEIASVGRGIVLLHDLYGWAQGSTVDMVKLMVPILKAQGYAFVRADAVPSIAALLPCHASCATCSGPNANQCTSCAANRVLAGGACAPCAVCPKGTRRVTACTAGADTACEACPAGTFAKSEGSLACASCGSCDDDDACTLDRCDASEGCVHDFIAGCAREGGADAGSGRDADSDTGHDAEAGRDAESETDREAENETDRDADTGLHPLPALDGPTCALSPARAGSGCGLAPRALALAAGLRWRRRRGARSSRALDVDLPARPS